MKIRLSLALGLATLALYLFGGGFAAANVRGTFTASARHVPGPNSPNHRLTPGARLAAGTASICRTGYSASVRNVPTSEKDAVYVRYGIQRVAYAYEVDHLVSLELGGSNAITNLWPEHYYAPWGARTKDRLENKLHALVCSGSLSLISAQRQEAANWIAAYKRYVGATSGGGSTSSPPPATTTPPTAAKRPAGATAKCDDGTYSYSAHHSGSCSHHGGVAVFYT
jgi:Protein of unknown function (DUF3761)